MRNRLFAAWLALALVLPAPLMVPLAYATVIQTNASIAAQNTFSTAIPINPGGFNLSLSGTWVATVHIQRSFDNGLTWLDVQSYAANIQDRGTESETGVLYRVGVKTGNYTSGTVVARISQ